MPEGQTEYESGNVETPSPDDVVQQAVTETDLNMPVGSQAERSQQAPRSGEGEGSMADTANEPDTGQSATTAPRKEQ